MFLAVTKSLLMRLVLWGTLLSLRYSPGLPGLGASLHLEQGEDVREEVSEVTSPGLNTSP